MQYSNLFVSALLSTAVAGMAMSGNEAAPMGMDMGGSKNLTEEQTCKKILVLNALVSLANNQSRLDALTGNNTAREQAIQAKAKTASTMLTELQSNSTLTAHCVVIDAALEVNATCTEEFLLQKFVDFAANDTLVSQAVNKNATTAAEVQRQATAAKSKIAELQSNATLQAACPAVFMVDECKMLVALKKFAALGMDQKKLDKLAQGNEDKLVSVKSAAGVAGMQLMTLEANTTLVEGCKKMGISVDDTSSKEKSSSSTSKSIANMNRVSVSALFIGVLAMGMAMM
ncbi:hypothetical protein DSL72_001113 [Monilinia vaccinii-corymbosi]|uniref:Cell wall protein n=1 Tax=Monilinia vaccinii-corymbosi TaxID=61207 RepID=A0A8A3P6X5_9HELO|nr:hypothetical protein DSL72_001113 [Monilinia vaccinii-corymbosi]